MPWLPHRRPRQMIPAGMPWSSCRTRSENTSFSLLLAAEWGHADRLLKMLDAPDTSQARKIKIMSLLGRDAGRRSPAEIEGSA